MCGITGIISGPGSPPPSRRRLSAMCDAIVHRGPDEEGCDIRGRVALGMRRLAIIDVEGGHQPYYNESGTVRVVFNGEIYNFKELREHLEGRGHTLRSAADGEVLPHLWEEFGTGFVERLNGMFAIALHDGEAERLVLVRDRLGIKPLFYAASNSHFVFGSEIKSVLASGVVDRSLNLDALGQFLSWEYIPGSETLLRGVQKLEPATLLELDVERFSTDSRSWWDVPEGSSSSDTAANTNWEEAIEDKLRESVRRQMVSDVPLGAFLSGGVDSSLIVSFMGNARTYSIGFDDRSYNELGWARKVSDHLGLEHKDAVLSPDILDLFDKLMEFMDDPIGDFSIFPTYLVSRLAREDVTVVLSGDGGDEVFGGYETYLAPQWEKRWRQLPAFLRSGCIEPVLRWLRPRAKKKGLVNKAKRFLEGAGYPAELGHARWRLFMGELLRKQLFTEEAQREMRTPPESHIVSLFEKAGQRPELDKLLYVDLKSYLCDNCLVKVDRMSMACSLEARVPFLDHELVELAFGLPHELKIAAGETKVLLKRIAARFVPHHCVYRPKQGFSIPIKNWLGVELRPLVEELLAKDRLASQGIFNPETVEKLKREHMGGTANHSHVLWSLLVFEDWHERWLQPSRSLKTVDV